MEDWQRRGYVNKNSNNRHREMLRKEQEERNKRRENAIKRFRNANMSKKVGVLKNQPKVPVFKGLMGYYRINVNYRNGKHYKDTSYVPKNKIKFNDYMPVANYSQSIASKYGLTRLNNAKTRNGYTVYYKKGFFGKTYYRVSGPGVVRINKSSIITKRPNNVKKKNNNRRNNNRNLEYIN